jgi:hypothetical protein
MRLPNYNFNSHVHIRIFGENDVIGMKTKKNVHRFIFLSSIILILGYLALWFLFPSILDRFGGFNLISFGLILFFASLIVLPCIYIFMYAQTKPIQRWQLQVALTYVVFAIVIALAFIYDSVLPPNVPIPWRYFILPLATVVIAFYLLRRVPKVREKLDKLSKDW